MISRKTVALLGLELTAFVCCGSSAHPPSQETEPQISRFVSPRGTPIEFNNFIESNNTRQDLLILIGASTVTAYVINERERERRQQEHSVVE